MANFFVIESMATPAEIKRAVGLADTGDIVQVDALDQKRVVEAAIKEAKKSQHGIRVVIKSGKSPFEF